jgi:hypothetical protein
VTCGQRLDHYSLLVTSDHGGNRNEAMIDRMSHIVETFELVTTLEVDSEDCAPGLILSLSEMVESISYSVCLPICWSYNYNPTLGHLGICVWRLVTRSFRSRRVI